MLKLSNCAEELAILLHVSSGTLYTPTSGSPTFSPRFPAYDAYPQRVEDNQLASSFSRSRSAQFKQVSSKQSIPTLSDTLPTTSFLPVKPLNTRRLPNKDASKSDPG